MAKLQLNRDKKKVAGVCAGLADFFEIEVKRVRRAFIFLAFFGPGTLIYISLSIAMRKTPSKETK